MKILVTGTAGFIGHALSLRLLARGDQVIGVDNLNDYYDVKLKKDRLSNLTSHPQFTDVRMDLEDAEGMRELFEAQVDDTKLSRSFLVRLEKACFNTLRPVEHITMQWAKKVFGHLQECECTK